MNINGTTKTMCVIGCPIAHTLSPQIHNTIIEKMNLNYIYTAYRVETDGLKAVTDAIRSMGIVGMNVTVPHKLDIMRYLDEIDAAAEQIGAVNTVKNCNGKLVGYNTDGEGFLRMLEYHGVSWKGKRVFLFGAGGAARAVCFTLAGGGASGISIYARRKEQAASLAAAINRIYPGMAKETSSVTDDASIYVNATPAGMKGIEQETPFSDFQLLSPGKTICDLIYNPRETWLMREAREHGHRAINGLGMLIFQAVAAFERFADVSVPRQVVDQLFHNLSFERNLVLTGFMASGKSTVGRLVAEQLAVDFIDVDTEIEKRAGKKIAEIFTENGEEYFRNLESEVIQELSRRKGIVLALGGGAVLRQENIESLRKNGVVVRLKTGYEAVAARTKTDRSRPILHGKTEEEVRRLMEEREPYYANCDVEVDSGQLSPTECADVVRTAYLQKC